MPHPLAVSGTPLTSSYDRATRRFRTSWDVARAGGPGRFGAGSRTEISVPRLVYPKGYAVSVSGGRVLSDPGARVLVIGQRAGADRVRVTVRPPP